MARSGGFILNGCLAAVASGALAAGPAPFDSHLLPVKAPCRLTAEFRQARAAYKRGKALYAHARYVAADRTLDKAIVALSGIYWRGWKSDQIFEDSGEVLTAAYGERLKGNFRNSSALKLQGVEGQLELCEHPP
jgi:hypothetical protein